MTVQFECLLCDRLYTEQDILAYLYFPITGVCYRCYRQMQKSGFSISCFGKRSTKDTLGYDALAVECREYCPDRKICPLFVNGKIKKYRKQIEDDIVQIGTQSNKQKYPFRDSAFLLRAFKLCMEGILKRKFIKWCHRHSKNPYQILKTLKSGEHKNGKKWEFVENGGELKISYPI